MKDILKIVKYEFSNVLRSKWMILYTLLFLVLTDVLFRFGGSGGKVVLSLMNVVLLLIPLMSIVFGVIYLYNSREFIEMMLSQPLQRRTLFTGMFIGLAAPLCAGFMIGVLVPFALHSQEITDHGATLGMLLLAGIFLTLIFLGIAFLVALWFEEKMAGLGSALFIWLTFAVAYDAIVLMLAFVFSDYPIEKAMIALSLLNPIDLARVSILMEFDVAALMGYTGAIFQRFFGSGSGIAITLSSLIAWTLLPFWWASRRFARKDY